MKPDLLAWRWSPRPTDLDRQAFRRRFRRIAAVHAVVVVAIVAGPWLARVLRRHAKPREAVMFVQFEPVAAESPAPPAAVPPPPEPPPVPAPPKPEKKKIELSKKQVVRDVEPPRPRVTPDRIRELLDAGSARPGEADRDDLPAWYYALVRQKMYEAWDQPSSIGVSSGLSATVRLEVRRDGTISRSDLIRESGHPVMDQSIRRALDRVRTIQALPSGFSGDRKVITVEFKLNG